VFNVLAEIADIIVDSQASSGLRPLGVTISAGSQEAAGLMSFGDLPVVSWETFLQNTTAAFITAGTRKHTILLCAALIVLFAVAACTAPFALLSAGMGASDAALHPDGSSWPSVGSDLFYVVYEGAMHNILNQVELTSYLFPLLYESRFPGNGVKSQRNSQMSVRYPPPADAGTYYFC
jgi:predicted dienelactone hydrolase